MAFFGGEGFSPGCTYTHAHKEKREGANIKMKENVMCFPTFDIEPEKKKKLNFFKIGKIWCFKYFFDDKEIFNDLLEYYNRVKYRFELGSVGARNKIMKYLEKKGFGPVLIEDTSAYTVKIDRFKKYGTILRNSIDYDEKGTDRIFVMNDFVSVEDAIANGAERVV
ncbi:hypothetical protein C5S53_07220 [Methanophagales archaeon]|nr:hypothetical protein C5S53_07220 [Methanophagales archaeon]